MKLNPLGVHIIPLKDLANNQAALGGYLYLPNINSLRSLWAESDNPNEVGYWLKLWHDHCKQGRFEIQQTGKTKFENIAWSR